jgi:hypothetical protein
VERGGGGKQRYNIIEKLFSFPKIYMVTGSARCFYDSSNGQSSSITMHGYVNAFYINERFKIWLRESL